MTLADDIRAVMRGLYRMRGELKRTGAWPHIEEACQALTRAIHALMRGEA